MRDLQMYAQKCLNNLHSIGIYPNITADKFKATIQHNSWGMCHSSRNNRTGVITHRITTAKEADLILVLDDGIIKEMGTHDELVKNDGLYSKLWGIQGELENEYMNVLKDGE